MKRLLEKIRFAIAYRLDKSTKHCWADLALFGMGYDTSAVFKCGGSACCDESKSHPNHTCYCGKFYNGRISTLDDFKKVCNGPEPDKAPF